MTSQSFPPARASPTHELFMECPLPAGPGPALGAEVSRGEQRGESPTPTALTASQAAGRPRSLSPMMMKATAMT